MTRLEQSLLAQIRERLTALDPKAAQAFAALAPALRELADGYHALGAAAKAAADGLFPALKTLVKTIEESLEWAQNK